MDKYTCEIIFYYMKVYTFSNIFKGITFWDTLYIKLLAWLSCFSLKRLLHVK